MSKQKLLLILSLSLITLALIGGTSAYFATSERTHNITTTSGVNIALVETTDQTDASGRPIPFQNITNAIPGKSYSKIPAIQNLDDGSVWVRIHLTLSVDGQPLPLITDAIQLDLNSSAWHDAGNGYYYYLQPLTVNSTTTPLFTTVTISPNLSNAYQDTTISLTLTAQGVQTTNNGSDVFSAIGWPEE